MARVRAIIVGIGGGIILSTALTAAMDAGAYTCCDPWGAVGSAAFVTAGTSVVSALTAATSEVSLVIQTGVSYSWNSGVGQLVQELSKRGASTKLYNDGAIAAKTQLYMHDKAGKAQENAVEAAAFDETITSAMMVRDQDETISKALRDYGRIHAESLVSDAHTTAEVAFQERRSRWSAGPVGMEYADIDATSLLTPESSMTYSDEGRQAALDYVQNLAGSNGLYRNVDTSTPQGRAADALTLADQAALSTAAFALNSLMADRTRRGQTEEK
ncbi:hypothetical protein [Stenotrophomonas maltophilia]|uniref:hypothetical protein n=1 Tax=Stenotrophomonas maltophilia TaxID=40324 RepID=UPI000C160403|nr:hypothetical protein [Stenotrophomonas maltophilia]